MKIEEFQIFDFDKTITIQHTFVNPGKYTPASNIKQGIKDELVHQDDRLSAVATYHNDPFYVASYIAHILGKPLTLKTSKAYEHDVLSIYGVKGEEDFLISTVLKNNFPFHCKMLGKEGKNTQINHILAYVQNTQEHILEKSDVTFYDDKFSNVRNAKSLKINVIYVDGSSLKFKVSCKYKVPALPQEGHSNGFFAAVGANNNNEVVNDNERPEISSLAK